MPNTLGLDFITLLVSNLETSYKFYKEVLGLEESSEKRPNAHAFSTKPCAFAIRQAAAGTKIENPGQGILVWFRTSDATAMHEDLKKRGVPIVTELQSSPFGMTFSFKDPDGYVISVHDGG